MTWLSYDGGQKDATTSVHEYIRIYMYIRIYGQASGVPSPPPAWYGLVGLGRGGGGGLACAETGGGRWSCHWMVGWCWGAARAHTQALRKPYSCFD